MDVENRQTFLALVFYHGVEKRIKILYIVDSFRPPRQGQRIHLLILSGPHGKDNVYIC